MKRELKHPVLGFVSGVMKGGTSVAAVFTLSYATSYPAIGGTFVPNRGDVVDFAAACFVVAASIWSIGLILVGYPLWSLLHYRGVRGSLWAALTGFIAVYAVGLFWPPASVAAAVEPDRMLLAISGGIVGAVVERVAYRQVTPPPARPS